MTKNGTVNTDTVFLDSAEAFAEQFNCTIHAHRVEIDTAEGSMILTADNDTVIVEHENDD